MLSRHKQNRHFNNRVLGRDGGPVVTGLPHGHQFESCYPGKLFSYVVFLFRSMAASLEKFRVIFCQWESN